MLRPLILTTLAESLRPWTMPFKLKLPKSLSRFGSRSKTGGSSHSASEGPAPLGAVASQDVDTSSSHDPSSYSLPQNPESHLPSRPPTNRVEPVISASNTTYLAPSTSNAIVQAPSVSGALMRPTPKDPTISASHDPQDRLVSSHFPQVPSQARPSSVTLTEDAPANLSILSGARDFGMRDLVHAPNATHVHIVNEESNQYNSVNIGASIRTGRGTD